MSKAIVVVDFAYKGPKKSGRGTGRSALKAVLKYLQYRDTRNNHLAQNHDYERWQDHGMGVHYHDILKNCDQLQSRHVLAWTWVISPAPDLMELIPENQRRDVVCDLTERVVEDYYAARGFDVPEFSFVLHDRKAKTEDNDEPMQHLHTHVVLPGTAPSIAERLAIYNNSTKGHDALFREIASQHFSNALDRIVGPEWRKLRDDEIESPLAQPDLPDSDDLDLWFPRSR
ncbi:MAG: hypothetical protein K8L97_08595 [Anaerolineae bacterium]|nr:hypothetical protein [Anaerolineae bacterium]